MAEPNKWELQNCTVTVKCDSAKPALQDMALFSPAASGSGPRILTNNSTITNVSMTIEYIAIAAEYPNPQRTLMAPNTQTIANKTITITGIERKTPLFDPKKWLWSLTVSVSEQDPNSPIFEGVWSEANRAPPYFGWDKPSVITWDRITPQATWQPWLNSEQATGFIYKMRTSQGDLVDVWRPSIFTGGENRYFCHGIGFGTYNTSIPWEGYTLVSASTRFVLNDPAMMECIIPCRTKDQIASYTGIQFAEGNTPLDESFQTAFQNNNRPTSIQPGDIVAFWAPPTEKIEIANNEGETVTSQAFAWFASLVRPAERRYWNCTHTAVIRTSPNTRLDLDNTILDSKNGSWIQEDQTFRNVCDVYSECTLFSVHRWRQAPPGFRPWSINAAGPPPINPAPRG